MREKSIGFLLVAAVALVAACGSGGSSPGGTAWSGRVSGTVTGATGVQMSLACIEPPSRRDVVADPGGAYVFSGVPATTCVVTPELAGYRFEPTSTEVEVGPMVPQLQVNFVARPVLQVRGSDIGGEYANLDVMHAGEVIEDAVVRVNGQVVPFEAVGSRYSGPVSPAVAPGGIISLEVAHGGSRVTATGVVPEPPVLTSPAAGEYFSSSEPLVVTWTSATVPEYFEVAASWSCGPDCGAGESFAAPGAARSLTIPAGALPSGEIQLRVYAYNDGEFTGDYEAAESYPGMNIRGESDSVFITHSDGGSTSVSGTISGLGGARVALVLSCMGVAARSARTDEQGAYLFEHVPDTGCTLTPARDGFVYEPSTVELAAESGARTGVDFAARRLLQVRGAAIGVQAATIEVLHAGAVVEDATVRVNGQTLPLRSQGDRYWGQWPRMLSVGDPVSLEVSHEGSTVTGIGYVPEEPVLTSPAAGARLAAGADLVVTWSSVTSPDEFLVSVGWSCGTSCGAARDFHAAPGARGLVVPAARLPPGAFSVRVFAYNDGLLTGDYDPQTVDTTIGPGMNIRAESNEVLVAR